MFKKALKIVLINILGIIFIVFSFEIILFTFLKKENYELFKNTIVQGGYHVPKFEYYIKYPPVIGIDFKNEFKGNNLSGRFPDGTQYKGKPIILFGCSFAYGAFLKDNQTFSYKLSEILKRPVYNRALSGTSPSFMLYQSEKEEFYNDVPPADTIIFIMIPDHYKRILKHKNNVVDNYFFLHYNLKHNKLELSNYNNPILNIIRSSYFSEYIYSSLGMKYIIDIKNYDNLTDLFLKYFIQTRKNLAKQWFNNDISKIKFIVVLYRQWKKEDIDCPYLKMQEDKFKKNGFIYIDTENLVDFDPAEPEYNAEDGAHPSEKAWDILTPLIIERADLK